MERRAVEEILRAPAEPGVYLMKGGEGRVIYVGKAKSLRDRLKSYLASTQERLSVLRMVEGVHAVEWLLTDTEKEALILEASLIKSHRPRYNIMLRDDKSYVSLRFTPHAFPRMFMTRKIVRDGSDYFGPYASAGDLRQTVKLLQKIFQVRDCSDSFFANRSRPCLQHQIRRCSAPCVGKVTAEAYAEQVRQTKMFLSGQKNELCDRLEGEMWQASRRQDYEEAARLRDRLAAVEETVNLQKVEETRDQRDVDAVGLAGDQEATLVKVLKMRRGKIVVSDEFLLHEPVSAASEIARAFVQQYYLEDTPSHGLPRQILVRSAFDDQAMLEGILGERRGTKVEILTPQRGRSAKFLRWSERNAEAALAERKRRSEGNVKILEELMHRLHLRRFPRWIEGYDISTFHGAEPVGARVVFIEGEGDKTRYRHYGIRTVKGSNDFAMLREVFERRFRKMEEEDRPDLVLVDGGKGQLKQVVEVLKELKIEEIDVASIAKEKELVSRSGKRYAPERIFLPGQKNPIIFPPSSKVLHLLMRVRDEAHRFGITRHRKARAKDTLRSLLSRVPGIGPKRQKLLLRTMGSLDRISSASLEDLEAVGGVPKPAARALFDFLHVATDSRTDLSDE